MGYPYIELYYSAIKMNELLIHATTWTNLKLIRLKSEIQLMREIHYAITDLKLEGLLGKDLRVVSRNLRATIDWQE